MKEYIVIPSKSEIKAQLQVWHEYDCLANDDNCIVGCGHVYRCAEVFKWFKAGVE